MISFLQYDVEEGELLFSDDFEGDKLNDSWYATGGEWNVKNGVLIGESRTNWGDHLYTHKQYPGDIILDFYGTMIPPCENDLNYVFRTDGLYKEKGEDFTAYIGGLNGWWVNQSGLEKYPKCSPKALSGYKFESGREYHIQSGIVENSCFLVVDDKLLVVFEDNDPIIDPDCMRVGLGVYCSKIAFRKFRLYRANVHNVFREYTPEF
ncbi:MAG: hypothetical protein Q4E54_05105 [Lachnospiraceae bacterium]|nr:hypothetical protein [Lachnospiraceae bacterium]